MTRNASAARIVWSELTPIIRPVNPAFRMASANEPPIRPTPKIATVSMPSLYGPAHSTGNHAQLVHQFGELLREQRLCTVAQRVIGIVMYFHQQAVGARRHSR